MLKAVGGAPAMRVELFGRPRVHLPDGPAGLSPLQLALVALVYGHGSQGLGRPSAARFLWRREADSETRHRIRQLLVDIRTKTASGLIETLGDDLRARADVPCDLADFERFLDQGALFQAASLVRPGFAELPPPSVSDEFLDWRATVNLSLLNRLRGRASAKWGRAADCGDWQAARDAAEALYVLGASDLDAWEKLIEARGRVGDVEAAECAYAAYMESVGTASGPSPDVHKAIRRVRNLANASQVARQPDPRVPLIGRHEALEAARALFKDVESGRFGFALISGESGIGKTRLLEELHREALFRDFRCLTAQAVELESRIPLNPLIDALRGIDLQPYLEALGRPWSAVIGAVLPHGTLDQPVGEPPPIQESALPRRLLDAFALLLQRLAQAQPTLFFIDDLQWADATTIAALQFVQRRWNGGPMGILATVRPDLVQRDDPVAQYLARSEGLDIRRIELRELSSEEALQLVQQLGSGRIGESPGRKICALAGLHPLYLTELTRDYLAGKLNLQGLPAADMVIPVSLEQIFNARIQHLDSRAMKVAGLLAAGARPLTVDAIAALAALSLDEAADAIEELCRARLVESEHDRVRIVHELFRSAIYRNLGDVRRALHHRTLAAHILAEGADESSGELAIHYARAGECERAARYGWVAADRAMETGTVAEAVHLYQLVIDNERDGARRAEATAGLARALHLGRDITRANPMLELAAGQLRANGRVAEALRLDIKRIEGLAEVGAVPISALMDGLHQLKQQASRGADWEAVALALDVELHLLHRAGDVPGIRRVFGEMREVAQLGSVEAATLTHAGLALGVLFDDPEEALRSARLGVSLSSEASGYRLLALIRLIVVLQYRGMLQLPLSTSIVEEARALAERSGDVLLRFSIESNLAVAFLDAGDIERADVLMAGATSMLGAADMDISRFNQTNNRAELALAQHDYVKAADAFTEAATYLGPTTPSYMQELVNAGLGLCALETGDLAESRRREQELSKTASHWHFDPTTILAFQTRLLDRRGRHREALDLLESSALDLEHRLVLAWLKVRALSVRLMIRRKVVGARKLALDARARAEELCLDHRVREFTELLAAATD
mgnify:CR=1 FL=1